MLQKPEFFGDEELALIYIAKRLRDAKRLEEVLTTRGLDYLVEADTYRGGVIFVAERVGAFFYVRPRDEDLAREVVAAAGYKPYETVG